jgi:3-hydroxybutyryl-CoA dehydrogenase
MTILTIAVIGAGSQGRAIAQNALRAGYQVVLEDFSIRTLEQAEASIRGAPSKLSTCTGVEEAIRDADLIIETAADEIETKVELFTIFDRFARPNAIFATTSATHPIADIAEVTSCPGRCVTLRFTPAEDPSGLTVVAGPQTSPQTIDSCLEFAGRLGIEVAILPIRPGP